MVRDVEVLDGLDPDSDEECSAADRRCPSAAETDDTKTRKHRIERGMGDLVIDRRDRQDVARQQERHRRDGKDHEERGPAKPANSPRKSRVAPSSFKSLPAVPRAGYRRSSCFAMMLRWISFDPL